MKIAVVTAQFNSEITELLRKGAIGVLENHSPKIEILDLKVPGAFEIPLAAKWAIQAGADAVVALGAVIRGDTSHYDYVCNAVERGCSELALAHAKPVSFGVLTTENEEQALARAGGSMGNKGAEAAQVALEMLSLQKYLKV